MMYSDHHITTLVTNSQTENHLYGYSIRNRAGDNVRMSKYPNRILEYRTAQDISLAKLEEETGISAQQLNRLEKGERRLNEDNMRLIARALKKEPYQLLTQENSPKVPVLGYVGAGERVFPIDDMPLADGFQEHEIQMMNCEFIDAPPGGAYRGLVALRVKGDSMEPLLCEGSHVYYEQPNLGGCDDLINKLSVICLKDGSVYIKILKRGFGYGRYNLQSTNTPKVIEDVELQWCAKVTFIKPV